MGRFSTYAVYATETRPCAECDADDAGLFARIDHGCAVDVRRGESDHRHAMVMLAGKIAKNEKKPVYVETAEGTVWSA